MTQATPALRLLITEDGRAWRVQFSAEALHEIRRATGLDLEKLADDPGGLCSVLSDDDWAHTIVILTILCSGQLDERDMSPLAFGNLLYHYGPRMTDAVIVILRALGDHFPRSWTGRLIDTAVTTLNKLAIN